MHFLTKPELIQRRVQAKTQQLLNQPKEYHKLVQSREESASQGEFQLEKAEEALSRTQ